MEDRFKNLWDDVTLNVSIKLPKHFAPELIAMLERIDHNGRIGHSEWVAIYSDGDGAFRPQIKITGPDDVINVAHSSPQVTNRQMSGMCYDAG